MFNRVITKIKNNAGETFTEILVAVLTVSLSSAMLVAGVEAAEKINSEAIIMDVQFSEDKKSAELKSSAEDKTGTGSVTFTNMEDGSEVYVGVDYYGQGDIVSYTGDAESSDPQGGGEITPPSPSPTEYPYTAITVYFDADGGTVSPTKKGVMYGEPYGDLPTPTKSDTYGECEFLGWYYQRVKVEATDTVNTNEDHTLTAHWKSNSSNVNIKLIILNEDGSETIYKQGTYQVGRPYSIIAQGNNPKIDGCTFLGWYTSPYGGTKVEPGEKITRTDNHKLYAHFSIKVTFNLMGHGTNYENTILRGQKIARPETDPATDTANKLKFYDWYSSSACNEGEEFDFNKKLYTSTTVYASYLKYVVVTFNPNGGSLNGLPNTKEVFVNKEYGELPTPKKTDNPNVFVGWSATNKSNKMADNIVTQRTTVPEDASDHTLYAYWIASGKISVTYEAWLGYSNSAVMNAYNKYWDWGKDREHDYVKEIFKLPDGFERRTMIVLKASDRSELVKNVDYKYYQLGVYAKITVYSHALDQNLIITWKDL